MIKQILKNKEKIQELEKELRILLKQTQRLEERVELLKIGLPLFIGNNGGFRLRFNRYNKLEYWKDNGAWALYIGDNNKITCPVNNFIGTEIKNLQEITEQEYKESDGNYYIILDYDKTNT